MVTELTLEQKKQFFNDGYIVLKGVVSDELVSGAQARIKAAKRGESLAPAQELTDLVNKSSVTPILREAMGTFDPPSMVHVGVTKQSKPSDYYTPVSYTHLRAPRD